MPKLSWTFGGSTTAPTTQPSLSPAVKAVVEAAVAKPKSGKQIQADYPGVISPINEGSAYGVLYDTTRASEGAMERAWRSSGKGLLELGPAEYFLPSGSGGGGYYRGGGGGGYGGRKASWSPTYTVEGAPDWWAGLTPNVLTGESAYLSLMNSLIPYMSPEDQRSTATYLATVFPSTIGRWYNLEQRKDFEIQNEGEFNKWLASRKVMKKDAAGNYVVSNPQAYEATMKSISAGVFANVPGIKQTPQKLGELPTEVTTESRSYMQSAERAKQAKSALDTLVASMASRTKRKPGQVVKSMGGGYQFLTSVLNQLANFGGQAPGEGQTRSQYQQMLGQLDPLMALAESSAYGAYKPLAQKIAQPFFSAGQVTPATKVNNRTVFGAGNPQMF